MFSARKIHIFRETASASILFQLDFLIAAKLMHLVSDVVFKALDVLLVGAAVDEVEDGFTHTAIHFPSFADSCSVGTTVCGLPRRSLPIW